MRAKDLAADPPRRWSEELGGIRWLPRLIDKARAALAGTLGDYLYGQCPIDRALLTAFGVSYRDFTKIVREAGTSDAKIFDALLQASADDGARARRFSDELSRRRRLLLFLLDVDDGHGGGWLQSFRGVIRVSSAVATRYIRYHSPIQAALLGLEIEAERASIKADAERGVDEEPYQWLTAANLDFTWKLLLSIVLLFLMLGAVLHFLERIGIIALIIIGAVFFAYLIYPIVRWLNRKLPLVAAILIVYAVLIGFVALGLSYLIPALSSEVQNLARNGPEMLAKFHTTVNDPSNPLLNRAPAAVRNELSQLPSQMVEWVKTHGGLAAGSTIFVLLGTAAFIGACIVVPVLAAYLLYDSEQIKRFFMGFIPEVRRPSTLQLLEELERVIGGFIRGQLLVGLTVGILIAVGLTLIHEPYAILIGAVAGALDLIPYIGPIIAAAPAIGIGFFSGGPREALLVLVVFVLANQAEGHIIAPNIVSRTIALSPSAVVLAVLIGGELYGVPGMFIAVPAAGIIRVLLLHVIPGSVSREAAQPVLTKDAST